MKLLEDRLHDRNGAYILWSNHNVCEEMML